MKNPSVPSFRATRREFLTACACTGLAANARGESARAAAPAELARIADELVLDTSFLTRPLRVASVELLQNGRVYLVRTRSTDGVEAVTVPNPARMALMYPLFLKQIAPFFIGKDARELERLLWDVYRHDSNYKLQGLALWICVAAMEMAVLGVDGAGSAATVGRLLWRYAAARNRRLRGQR